MNIIGWWLVPDPGYKVVIHFICFLDAFVLFTVWLHQDILPNILVHVGHKIYFLGNWVILQHVKQNFVSCPILCWDTVPHLNLCLCLSGLGGVPGLEVGAEAPSGLAILLTPASSSSVLLFILRLWSDRNVSTEDILWTDWDSQQIMPIVMSSHCAGCPRFVGINQTPHQRHGTRGVDFWKLIKIQKCSIVSGYVLLGGPLWIKWTETFHLPDCLQNNIQQTFDAIGNFVTIAESLFSDRSNEFHWRFDPTLALKIVQNAKSWPDKSLNNETNIFSRGFVNFPPETEGFL